MALESCEEGNSGTSRVFLIAAQFLQPLLLQIKAVWQLSLFTFCSTTLFLLVCLKELFISPYFLLFCLDYTLQAFLCWGLVPSLVISVLGSITDHCLSHAEMEERRLVNPLSSTHAAPEPSRVWGCTFMAATVKSQQACTEKFSTYNSFSDCKSYIRKWTENYKEKMTLTMPR